MKNILGNIKKSLLIILLNGQEVNGNIVGYIASPIPYEKEDYYKLPENEFFQKASYFVFKKPFWIIGELIRFTLKLHIKLLGNSIVNAIILLFLYVLTVAFLSNESQFNKLVEELMTQKGITFGYLKAFAFAYWFQLVFWVLSYGKRNDTFIFFCRRNWINFITGKSSYIPATALNSSKQTDGESI